MVTIVVDENAHNILKTWKQQAMHEGIEKPSHNDAIRWAETQIKKIKKE